MAAYDYRCPEGHLTEHTARMGTVLPSRIACAAPLCDREADRVFHAPAAIHFKGRGFYATDVTATQERRRRPNAGDDLPRGHDPAASRIARSL